MLTPEDREFILMLNQGLKAEIKFTNEILGKDIAVIKEQTIKTNSRVNHHDEELKAVFKVIDTRSTTCPNIADYKETKKDVEELKTKVLTKEEIRKQRIQDIAIISTVVGVLVAVGKAIFGV